MTDANPATNFSVGAAIVWSICALIALAFGGFVAGRFSHSLHSGFAHGILVWSLTLIISLLLLTAGTGMVMGGALKVLGEGLEIGGKAVAAGAGDLAKEGVKRSSDQLGSFIDEAVQSVPTNAAPKAATRAKREIGFAVTKLFAPGNDIASPDNRTAVIKSLVDYAQMSEADATKTVDDWMTSYKNLKAELDNLKAMAEQKAREAADKAASNLSCAAMWSFFALLIGLLVTALAGRCGARCALRYADSPSAPPL
jgi:polyhydroxyalkanoate synthesis regulator phasin